MYREFLVEMLAQEGATNLHECMDKWVLKGSKSGIGHIQAKCDYEEGMWHPFFEIFDW
jgi:hypothetical protein